MPWERAISRITNASWGAIRCLTVGSQPVSVTIRPGVDPRLDPGRDQRRTHPEGTMSEYKFVHYETLDEGRIARIMLNRPEARNAQNRGMLVELNDAFLQAEADDEVRVVILGGDGADVLVRPRHGLEGLDGGVHARPQPAPDPGDQRRHPQGRREPDAAGVALLLREHPPLAQPAQDHHRPGARRRLRRRPHADVGLRPHRRRRRHRASPTSSAPASACAASSTSPTRGSSAPARPRSCCSPATRSTPTRPTPSAW